MVPKIIIVQPKTNLTITATLLPNNDQPWSHFGPGEYGMRIDIGSDKTQHFDYEYMGVAHSEAYNFVVKADATNTSTPLRRD